MTSNTKPTIFDLLTLINNHNINGINNTENEKVFVPYLSQRWLTCTSNAMQIVLINEYVNPYTFTLHKHKELLWKLMCVCSSKNQRYTWIKQTPQNKNNNVLKIIAEYYGCSTKEAKDYNELLSMEDVLEMAEMIGKDKEEIAKIKKEFK